MLYIANISKKFKEKGIQDYEIRVGDPFNYSIIGKFKHHAEKPLVSLVDKAAESVGNYNEFLDFLNKYQEIESNKNDKKIEKRENLIALMIANISPVYKKKGLQQYVIQILTTDKTKNYKEELGRFEHIYEDGADGCFRKAKDIIDDAIFLKNYKKIFAEIKENNKKEKEIEDQDLTFSEMPLEKKELMIKMYEDKMGIIFNEEQLNIIFQDIRDETFSDFNYDVDKKYLEAHDASFLLSFVSLRLTGKDLPSAVDIVRDKSEALNHIEELQKAVSYPDWEINLYSVGDLPGKKISKNRLSPF